jgi:hypothetical protein
MSNRINKYGNVIYRQILPPRLAYRVLPSLRYMQIVFHFLMTEYSVRANVAHVRYMNIYKQVFSQKLSFLTSRVSFVLPTISTRKYYYSYELKPYAKIHYLWIDPSLRKVNQEEKR